MYALGLAHHRQQRGEQHQKQHPQPLQRGNGGLGRIQQLQQRPEAMILLRRFLDFVFICVFNCREHQPHQRAQGQQQGFQQPSAYRVIHE